MADTDVLRARLAHSPAVLVQVDGVRGSAPREVGAWMAVFRDGCLGSIGGGQLEHQAVQQALDMLQQPGSEAGADTVPVARRHVALGPSLGQCCGGAVDLRFESVGPGDVAALSARLSTRRWPVALFGAGHVGAALCRLMPDLPLALHWFDSRDAVFPDPLPAAVQAEQSDPPEGAVPGLPAGARVLIMTHSHAQDLALVAACLDRQRQRGDLPWIGLIGSQTKWATFRRRLLARGYREAELDRVCCPIGVPGVVGKQPAVIAVAVAAQLLQTLPGGILAPCAGSLPGSEPTG
ncbi:MAG: xanthine dehydrogenase accessory protein XdhC [Rhodoferax sp.]|nr:xanthine dehydrogenase accessory protein XdhC [Rhodoferax sp.]